MEREKVFKFSEDICAISGKLCLLPDLINAMIDSASLNICEEMSLKDLYDFASMQKPLYSLLMITLEMICDTTEQLDRLSDNLMEEYRANA